jgi:hypothetical protein
MDDGLTAGEVARRLGVAVTTLRSWHQRYGLGPTGHSPGRHRRYTNEDLDRLDVMRSLTVAGVTPAEAAARATGAHRATRDHARDGGGRIIAVGRAGAAARGLARAAVRLDAPAVMSLLTSSIADAGVVATWEELLVPVLRGIGDRHAATGGLIDVEHLLSGCVSAVFGTVEQPAGPAAVLLACADEEQHSLPLEALGAALAEGRVASRLLGARVPAAALADAVRRIGPAAVVVWAHAPAYALPAQLVNLTGTAGRPLLRVAAGPGWAEIALPSAVVRPTSLSDSVALLSDL